MMQKIPPITRNLILINVVCYLVQAFLQTRGIDVADWLGLHFALAERFYAFQLITYMFLHGSLTHLFFNMFSLWMFGGIIEKTLGYRRFLLYYFVTGIGAGVCQEVWQTTDYLIEGMNQYENVNAGGTLIPMAEYLNLWTTIGASGACYGVLLAFGMLYPNERLMLLIPPIPIKAKYLVAGYAVIELLSTGSANDNVAHFAHLGGMLFGWALLWYWKRKTVVRSGFRSWEEWNNGSGKGSLWQRFKNLFASRGGKRNASVGNAHHTVVRESDYEYNMRTHAEEERMDEILDKVRRSGYDGLTKEEKQELFRLSRK